MIVRRHGWQRPGHEPLAHPPALGPIVQVRLYTAHTIITGTLRLAFHRLSDHLNFGPPILELGQAELVRLGHPDVHRAQQETYIQKDQIIVAIDRLSGDYAATHPELRESKGMLNISADLGHFVINGLLHCQPGIDFATWMIDGQVFVPLTQVTLYGDGPEPATEQMAIINRARLTALLH